MEPDAERKARYDRVYSIYQRAVAATRDLAHDLVQLNRDNHDNNNNNNNNNNNHNSSGSNSDSNMMKINSNKASTLSQAPSTSPSPCPSPCPSSVPKTSPSASLCPDVASPSASPCPDVASPSPMASLCLPSGREAVVRPSPVQLSNNLQLYSFHYSLPNLS